MLNKNGIFSRERHEACLWRTQVALKVSTQSGLLNPSHLELSDSLWKGPSGKSWADRDLWRRESRSKHPQLLAGRQGRPTQWVTCHQAKCPQRALVSPAAPIPRLLCGPCYVLLLCPLRPRSSSRCHFPACASIEEQ